MTFTPEQTAKSVVYAQLLKEGRDDEAFLVYEELEKELSDRKLEKLLLPLEASPPKAVNPEKPRRSKSVFRKARRVSKSPEVWRCLSNYPIYEISSHGRVRSLNRAKPEDWLKPRRRWFKGMCTDSVVLWDRDGKRREIFIGKLLIAAGFMNRPAWMKAPV